MSDSFTAIDRGDLKKYRIEIPNLVDDMNLDPYEFRLYCHYKRVAGGNNDGSCYESVRTTAKKCQISIGKVVEARESLKKKGLIQIDEPKTQNQSHTIYIVDIWLENFQHYSTGVHHVNSGVHVMNARCSPHEPKKEQLKKEPNKEVVGEPIPVDETARECLLLLSRVKGFPRDDAENAKKLAEYREEYPHADAIEVCQDFRAFIDEAPFKKGDKPRLRLRNFFKTAHKRVGNGHITEPKRRRKVVV